jgi:hypothetical protein
MLKWKGQWRRLGDDRVSYSIYEVDDVVSYNGGIYVALKNTDGTINPEINHTNQIHKSWDLMGSVGDFPGLIDGGIYC